MMQAAQPSTHVSKRSSARNSENLDVRLMAAARRLQCASNRLEALSSKEIQMINDLKCCVARLHQKVQQEEEFCAEVDGELSELLEAIHSKKEITRPREDLQHAVDHYRQTLMETHR